MVGLRIVEVGWSTTVQDLGRHGYRDIGVPTAGAVDRTAHDLANRLVGNDTDAATLETTRGLVIEAQQALVVATSADGARHTLRVGDQLRVNAATNGVWGYLAVRGGIDVAAVLGSRSQDTLSGLGPPFLEPGVVLPVGADPATVMATDFGPPRSRGAVVRLQPGPRGDMFTGGLTTMFETAWTVQQEVSRVGVRLSARHFGRTEVGESNMMPSEGLVEGAVQITPSGEPIVMLANHPTTGGYPVIAVVEPRDIAIIAQAQPGSTLTFRGE